MQLKQIKYLSDRSLPKSPLIKSHLEEFSRPNDAFRIASIEGDDDLLPDQAAQSEQDAPDPLLEAEWQGEEDIPFTLNDCHLEQKKYSKIFGKTNTKSRNF